MKATKTIWKTVVFAGAMLGASACGPKSDAAGTGPTNTGGVTGDGTDGTGGDGYGDPCDGDGTDPCAYADPCAGVDDDPCRSRGVDDDGGGDVGRGFLLN